MDEGGEKQMVLFAFKKLILENGFKHDLSK